MVLDAGSCSICDYKQYYECRCRPILPLRATDCAVELLLVSDVAEYVGRGVGEC